MKLFMRLHLFMAAAILALLVGAVLPGSAYADEGTPPTEPTPTEEVAVGAAVEESSTVETPTVEETPAPEETTAVEETPVVEETPAPEVATEEITAPEGETPITEETTTDDLSLADLPEGTELVVLDENGEALSLASEEAADAVAGSDPIWCPTGVTPVASTGGCSPSFTSFDELIAWLEDPLNNAATAKAGAIWVAASYDSSAATCAIPPCDDDYIYFDGAGTLSHMAPFSLTIKGGWTETGTTIDTGDRSTFDGTALLIENWIGDITLSDILITGANSTFGNNALYVGTAGKVTLTRVDVDTNSEYGAYIPNAGGVAKDVVISNSSFSNNAGGNGLEVISHGTITLASVIAENNGTDINTVPGDGATLSNVSSFNKDVVVTNSTFSNNHGVGLGVSSSGKITLTNVTVTGSEGIDGAILENNDGIKDVVISNSTFSDNGVGGNGKGLNVVTKGLITITNITATGNTEWGAVLDNCGYDSGGDDPGDDPSDDTCANSVAKNVTLLGTNIFADNVQGGLAVYSLSAININNLISNSNDGWGAILLNHKALTNQPVTLTKYSEFKYNGSGGDGGGGLQIISRGTVTLYNITASNNINDAEDDGGTGLYVNNTFSTAGSNVTLIGTNTFNNNFLHGVEILSKGAITASSVTAYSNGTGVLGGFGALLDNSNAASPKSVTLTGTNQFNANYSDGLRIESRGALSLSNITANDSQNGWGADLDNTWGGSASQQNVLLAGVNTFNGNAIGGQDIESYGTVTLNKITASDNQNGNGLEIENQDGDFARNISIIGYATFDGNAGDGLSIDTRGAVTIANLTATGNGFSGANFYANYDPNLQGTISLTGVTNVSDNMGGRGLYILGYGAVTISKLTASGNDDSGVEIDNRGGTVVKNVTITGYATANQNGGAGLRVESDGAISVSNLTTNENIIGGYLTNDSNPAIQVNITLSGVTSSSNNNGGDGLYIRSYGTVSISKLTASENDSAGADIHNNGGTFAKNVTISSYAVTNENGGHGINVLSEGVISISNVTANDNGGNGVTLDNGSATAPKAVTVSGTNSMEGNGNTGLFVFSRGAVTISNITAELNGQSAGFHSVVDAGSGIYVDNVPLNPLAPQNVTFKGYVNVEANFTDGLHVNTYGTIVASNIYASGNGQFEDLGFEFGGYGAFLTNSGGSLVRPVTLSGFNEFSLNYSGGLVVETLGAIKASNLNAAANSGTGVKLENFSAPNATTTLTGSHSFIANVGNGLEVFSSKTITLSNLTATGNDGNGVLLDNEFSGNLLPADVKVTGTNVFSGNGYSGLVVLTYGAATLNNLTAEDNGWQGGFSVTDPLVRGFGVLVDGCRASAFNLQDCSATISKSATISGTNTFNENAQTGLLVQSLGLIKANALSASENQEAGVQLLNNWDQALPAGVTLTGANSFIDNDFQGLVIFSHRTITLSNVTANLNGDGASINTSCNSALPTCVANVVMTGTNTFNDNGDFGAGVGIGLDVSSVGSISINNLTANGNGEKGAHLTNASPSIGTPFIKLTGMNNFIGNKYYGLTFESTGTVTLAKITADGNLLGDGVNGYSDGAITITCGSMTNNGLAGLSLTSLSTITLKGVFLLGNGDNSYPVGATIVRSC